MSFTSFFPSAPTAVPPIFLFVDGSYYCFHRYYALMRWWKSAYPDEPLGDPFLNERFVGKFRKTFVEHLREMPKKLKFPKGSQYALLVGKDCPREQIWRNQLYPAYKATRANGAEDGFMGGPFFRMAYDPEDHLFFAGGAKAVLHHPHLEADDCIALSVKHIASKYPTAQMYIITSDRDYLQLNSPQVRVLNLSYKPLTATGNADRDLLIKICMGDVSDNIPPAFPKCGPKTAQKCADEEDFLNKKLNDPVCAEQFERNRQLIDFRCIPSELVAEFYASVC